MPVNNKISSIKIDQILKIKKIIIILIFLILSIFLILFFSYPISAASETIYLTATGAGTKDGSSLANAMSPAEFNAAGNWSATDETAGKIDPGDTVLLYDDGGISTTTLTIQGSGSSGKVITIKAQTGETPILSGVDSITDSFALVSGEIYKTIFTPATDPKVVYEDGNLMDCYTHDQIDSSNMWEFVSGFIYKSGGLGATTAVTATPVQMVFDHSGGTTWHELTEVMSQGAMTAGTFFRDTSADYVYVWATGNENLSAQADGFIHIAYTYKDTLARNQCYYDMATNELYIRASNGAAPNTHALTYSARSYGIDFNGKQYITIDGLTIQKQNTAGIYGSFTSAAANTVQNNIISYTGQYSINLVGSGAMTNFNITGNNLSYNPTRYMKVNISGGQNIYPLINVGGNGNVDSMNILYNKVDAHVTGVNGSGNSAERDGIVIGANIVNGGLNITGNEVTEVDHGIYLSQSGQSCPNTNINYNYVHNIDDDGLWLLACANISNPENVHVVGNVITDTGDDNIALAGTNAYVINNTLANTGSNNLEFNLTGYTGSIIKNNIIVVNGASTCTGAGDGTCAISFKQQYNLSSSISANNNLYYNSGGSSAKIFFIDETNNSVQDGASYSLSEWQALSGKSDSNSYFANPNLDVNNFSNSEYAQRKGINYCSIVGDLLSPSATWSVGVAPKLGGACPEADPLFDVGAFNIVGRMLR